MLLLHGRFFTGQKTGHVSSTPHNPFSISKSNVASVARKLNWSSVHHTPAENSGEKSLFDEHEHLQNGNIDIVEQSPVKDTCNGWTENTGVTSTVDNGEVPMIPSPSSPVTAVEDVVSSSNKIDEENGETSTPLQLEKGNGKELSVCRIGRDERGNIAPSSCESNEVMVEQKTVTKKLGHRDLREFAFIRRSERKSVTSMNNSVTVPGSDNTLR